MLVTLDADVIVLSEVAVDELGDGFVRGWGAGERLDPARHALHTEIKGVSYHALAVRERRAGWSARVILDV